MIRPVDGWLGWEVDLMSGELADRTCRECGQPVFDHEETGMYGRDRHNDVLIWATERAIQQIDNAVVDHVLRFLLGGDESA